MFKINNGSQVLLLILLSVSFFSVNSQANQLNQPNTKNIWNNSFEISQADSGISDDLNHTIEDSIKDSVESKVKKHEENVKSVNITQFETNNSTSSVILDEKKYDDPYEGYNRIMYDINRRVDIYILKPISQLYVFVTPLPVKRMITNFYNNIYDISVVINNILQADIEKTGSSLSRLTLNSTFGMFGLIDVAHDVGFEQQNNDYGVTFGRWGMTQSPYFVIPLIGPSTLRDSAGRVLSFISTPMYFMPENYSAPLFGMYYIDNRANLLTAEKIMDTVADDEYIFVRNSYIDYRDSLIRGEKIDETREANEEQLIDEILNTSDKTKDNTKTDELKSENLNNKNINNN